MDRKQVARILDGLFRDEERAAQAVEEAEVYRALGLAYILPELRENLGEIEPSA